MAQSGVELFANRCCRAPCRRRAGTAPGFCLLAGIAVLLSSQFVLGQENPPEGKTLGGYAVEQSFELGYRQAETTGSGALYNTFVNLHTGPRLLEQTLSMRSVNNQGLLFDSLSVSSFGYGGDPNNATRLRASKNRWYDFAGSFRRDRDYWDYDLLANPLNPPNSNPSVPILVSPHSRQLVRRMSDFSLKLMPQSRISVRLGFGRNVHEGPALSTFHEGTEVPIFESYRTTNNSYSMGVDFRLLPRTSISYDQFVSAEKGDSSWQDQNLTYRLSNGTPADLGLVFNTAASQPCAAPITSFATTPPTINARCNAYLSYTRFAPSRSVTPTEQLSVQSNYFRRVDVSARAAYSSGENKVQIFDERFNGFVSRTLERQFQFSGPSTAKRVSVTSDLGVTIRISPSMRLIESFRWSAYRIPGVWNSLETALYGPDLLTQPNAYDPSRCPPPFTAASCPKHGSSTSPDVTAELFQWYLGQDSKYNQTELAYDFARRGGIRVGYRYGHRDITQRASNNTTQTFFPDAPNRGACAGRPLSGTNTCQVITTDVQADETPINEHSFLLGAWTHPMDSLRASLDVELRSADRAFTRISPRNLQQYRVRGSYKPGHWVSMAGSLNILEQRNNEPQIGNLQHNRAAGFSVALTPGSRWSLDAGYDYRNTFSQTNICFVSTPTPAGSSPCPAAVAFLQDISLYRAVTHFGHFAAMVHPVKRLTTELGYSINSVDGTSLLLNPLAPLGPLRSQYHQPWASVAVAITSQISGKAAWNYWGYNEDSAVGPTAPRDFHANISTVSLRYAF